MRKFIHNFWSAIKNDQKWLWSNMGLKWYTPLVWPTLTSLSIYHHFKNIKWHWTREWDRA